MNALIAVTSDQHCGSAIALCPPEIRLDDGGIYKASPVQQWLYNEGWVAYWDWVARLRDEHKASLLCEFNGDMVDGSHHNTTQIISGNPTAQAAVVDAVMSVPLSLGPDGLAFVRGTEAHVGKSAAHEERIARGLEKDGRPVYEDQSTGTASHWHLRLEVQGVRIDFKHHGRMGQRPWTTPNVVLNFAAEIFHNHARDGVPHPHIAVRSHYHRYVDSGTFHPTRVIQTPAFQVATAYTYRIAVENLADVGGVAVLIRDGKYEILDFIQKPERPKVWVWQG